MNWDEKDIEVVLTAVGFPHIHIQLETETSQRQITEAHFERWFGEGEGERVGYGRRLQTGGLTQKEVAQVETLYRQQLLAQVVGWETAVAFILAH
ncbi:MAG: hypothetical protein HC804_14980 [Anaerolineae bacterium]|nr:hypothetical protein [Anaerolineae bacterium]